jgi:2-haloacid dehalogenase
MRYDAVLFDLLTALLDSWSLWNSVAGGDEIGQRWRAEYLRISYRAGTYLPYEDLVTEAAVTVGLDASLGRKLAESYPEIEPWPEVRDTLSALGLPLAIVTNCSE